MIKLYQACFENPVLFLLWLIICNLKQINNKNAKDETCMRLSWTDHFVLKSTVIEHLKIVAINIDPCFCLPRSTVQE